MNRNFFAKTETTLSLEGEDFDLHNDFALASMKFCSMNRSVDVTFHARKLHRPSRLNILFLGVSLYRVQGFDEQMPPSEGACLDSFGFLHPDELSVMNGFLPESFATSEHHIIFLFRDGLAIKLYAKEAVAEIIRN